MPVYSQRPKRGYVPTANGRFRLSPRCTLPVVAFFNELDRRKMSVKRFTELCPPVRGKKLDASTLYHWTDGDPPKLHNLETALNFLGFMLSVEKLPEIL